MRIEGHTDFVSKLSAQLKIIFSGSLLGYIIHQQAYLDNKKCPQLYTALVNSVIVVNTFSIKKPESYMSHKKEIKHTLDTEQAKELELDETPKPTRKVSNPSIPVSNYAESNTQDRIKGRRLIK